jgi:hypothetical protein
VVTKSAGPLVALVLAVSLALVGCGGSSPTRQEGPFGSGADAYWLWRPHGKPKAVVVFMHGLDPSELTPVNHVPWLEHLASRGADVIFPKYEARPLQYGALRHALFAVGAALQRLGWPSVPVFIIGYSRGARLAVELATVTSVVRATPAALVSVYPVGLNPNLEQVVDLRGLDMHTKVVVVTGQEDLHTGEHELLERLQEAGFSMKNVRTIEVKSKGTFHADHLSPMRTVPAVKEQLWAPVDELIDALSS